MPGIDKVSDVLGVGEWVCQADESGEHAMSSGSASGHLLSGRKMGFVFTRAGAFSRRLESITRHRGYIVSPSALYMLVCVSLGGPGRALARHCLEHVRTKKNPTDCSSMG
jgi:hypothetical protein